MAELPLKGIRICDCSRVWAGPHCAELLADLGAEVIKVETPQGDLLRGSKTPPLGAGAYPGGIPGERPWNRAGVFNSINRNKLAASLNLNMEQGKWLFKELVKISDVVVENFLAGTMDKLGVGYEELRAVKPDIIMVSINAYGSTGPWAHYHTYGVILEPVCGFMSLTGYVDDEMPMRSGVDHIDPLAGIHAAGAIVAALLYRQKTGKGQQINVSMLESGVNFIAPAVLDYIISGRMLEHQGNRHRAMAPHGCYRCQGEDNWLTIAVGSDEEWESFCDITGNPSWKKEGRFSDLYSRLKNQDELDKLVEAWTIKQDKYEAMHALQKAGVPAGAVLDIGEVCNEPHLRARNFFQTVDHPEAGTMELIGPRFKLSGAPTQISKPAPCFGEHNAYVFRGLLGMSEAEFNEAVQKGVILTEPTL